MNGIKVFPRFLSRITERVGENPGKWFTNGKRLRLYYCAVGVLGELIRN